MVLLIAAMFRRFQTAHPVLRTVWTSGKTALRNWNDGREGMRLIMVKPSTAGLKPNATMAFCVLGSVVQSILHRLSFLGFLYGKRKTSSALSAFIAKKLD